MGLRLTWDEAKRRANLEKHGLDLADAEGVLASRYRLDVPVVRNGEARVQSISYVLEALAVLTVVHVPREGLTRVVSFRRAGTAEREIYRVWLEDQHHDP